MQFWNFINNKVYTFTGDETVQLYGYKKIRIRTILFYLLSVLSLGAVRLLCHWKVRYLIC